MWMPKTARCMVKLKTRSFLSPLFFSNSYCTSTIPFLPTSSLIRRQISATQTETQVIANSFRDWFRTSKFPLFERIFQILNEKDDDWSSTTRAHEGLSQLGLHLSESFVLEVLRYKKDDVLACLKFFDWAGRQPGFCHTRATFVAIFKIMSKAKLTSLMLDLLDTYIKQRDLHRVRFNDMLVMGYALAGKVDIALQIFGKMRFHGIDLDEVAYHVLLNALVEEQCFDVVNVVLGQIRMRGHENKVTHALTMKSLCKQDKLTEAEEYLRGLVSGEKVVSGHVLSLLVDALCKKEMFLHAGKLIHEFGEMGVVPMQEAYGVWIMDLVQAGKVNGAMEFFQTKKSLEGYIPEVFRYNFLIHKLLMQNRLQEVCDLLMDMKDSHIVPDKVTMNAALRFFCKAGLMDVALELYKLKSEFGLTPSSWVYNFIINNLCGEGSTDEAYRVLKHSMNQGYIPGKRTFSILADALCREGKLDKVKDLIMFGLECKFMPTDVTYEKFIRALCRAKRVEDGYLIHGELNRLNKNVSENTYSSLIRGFNNARRGDIGARLLIEMQEKGYQPSRRLFRAVICCLCEMESPEKHFLHLLEMQLSRYGVNKVVFNFFIDGAGHARRPELAREVYEMMKRTGIEPNLNSDLFMLQSYLRTERIADALNFFDDISTKRMLGRKMYNCMVVGLCKTGKAEFALAILRQARNGGVVPSVGCYEELIKLYCSEKKYDDAIKILNDMEKARRKISSFIGNVFLLHSMQSRDLYNAWVRSRDVSVETPNSSMLGQLIAAFSGHMRVDSDVEDLEEIIQKCFPLDLYSYNMLLRKLITNQIDGACQLFNQMCQKGYEPNRWTYDILVHGLFMHGRKAEARIWAEEMIRMGYFPTDRTKLLL